MPPDKSLPKPGTKDSHPIDIEVGNSIKAHRLWRGLTQVDLGEALGVTFQQIQKYEKGTNRISASRLAQAAKVFGVPVSSFFPGQTNGTRFENTLIEGELAQFIASGEGHELNGAFSRIASPAVRKV
jgi:transcriptional regulator with XRE-family HTH domain